MATYRMKPTKPMALIGVPIGVAMIVFALTRVPRHGAGQWFIWVWVAFVVLIVGYNLFSAFSSRGGTPLVGQTIVRDDGPGDRP